VLYKASDEKFQKGYDLIQDRWSEWDNIMFIPEVNFAGQIRQIILGSIGYICFLTDDCIFYRPSHITPSKVCKILTDNKEILSFNFRLGDNTIIQNYLTGETQIPLADLGYKHVQNYEDVIRWRWKVHPANYNYGYFFSWDGCAYRTDFLYEATKNITFTNPRTMEGNIAGNIQKRNTVKEEFMAAPLISNVVVNTINKVQDFGPEAGMFHNYSVEDLNERFLSGGIISLEAFDFENVVSSHTELELTFEEYK